MDYDDIDYDEDYSMRDIDNNWLNSNMEYDETDSDFDSEIDDYNSSTNNWSILTGDKINLQTNKHNDSFLDRINKKLKSLEATERSFIVERKNDSFLDLYEILKTLNSPLKNERDFEPQYRSSSTKTMTDSWYINNNSKEEIDKTLQTLKVTNRKVDEETGPIKERVTRIKDKRKDLLKERSTIESVRDIINEDKERGKIRKGIVKETLDKFERQNGDKKEVIRRKLDIKDEIDKVNNSNDSLKEMVEKQNNKEEASSIQIICKKLEIEIDLQEEKEFSLNKDIKRQKDEDVIRRRLKVEIGKDELKEREIVNRGGKNKNNKLKEEIEKRLKLIEESMVDTQNDSLTELIKKIEILNAPLDIEKIREITVLNTIDLSDNEKTDKYVRNTIDIRDGKDNF